MTATQLPRALTRLIELHPKLRDRVGAMYQGCVRKGKATPERAADWVLNTLRREAEERAAQGASKPVEYRNDRQYARDKRAQESAGPRRDSEFLDALSTIGAIDRVRLERGQ